MQKNSQDIQIGVEFLYTRIQSPDGYKYQKLVEVMQYLCGTRLLSQTIEPGDHPSWWVESS